jgi:hypothetical protein
MLEMSVDEHDEMPRQIGEGESDAVTIAFSDLEANVCGVARIGRALVEGTSRTSGLAVLFAGGQPVAVRADSGEPDPDLDVWGGSSAAGVETEVLDPLSRWTVTFTSEDGAAGFDLELTARSQPASLSAKSAAGKLGAMQGYDQLVDVTGSVTTGGTDQAFAGTGQRGHSWGRPDWSKLSSSRAISLWLEAGGGCTITTVRPANAASHNDEGIHAALVRAPDIDREELPEPVLVQKPRISTTYDDDGRHRGAGLELLVSEDDDFPFRAAGDVACGTTIDLGQLRLQCAFFTWESDLGRAVGRYDVLLTAKP